MAFVGVALPNLDRFTRILNEGLLYAGEWRYALDKARDLTKGRAEDRAPKGEHNSIAPAITSKLDPQPIPMYATVDVAPLENDGFRYPWALDFAKSWVHRARTGKRAGRRGRYLETTGSVTQQDAYHYHGTKKPTRRWFRGALAPSLVGRILDEAAKGIEAKWRNSI